MGEAGDYQPKSDAIGGQQVVGKYNRVGRVLSYFSSRRNWNSPTPSPVGECAPPPPTLVPRGGTLAGGRGGWGSPNSDEGKYTLVLYIHMYFVVSGF